MDKILEFWNNNGTAILSVVLVGGTALAVHILNKVLKKTGNNVLTLVMATVSKLFGGKTSNELIDNNVSELGFVKDMKNHVDNLKVDWEIKLIENKRRLLSPKIGEMERVTFQYQYDLILSKIGENNLSEGTVKVLEKLEELKGE